MTSTTSSAAGKAPTHLRKLGDFLDQSIRLPGGYRIGWDGIIGLIPGFGDAAGMLLSAYIVLAAAYRGVSLPALIRMIVNIVLEVVIGMIPIIGDLFDFTFKANLRNLALIDAHFADPNSTRRTSWLRIGIVTGLLLLILAIPVMLIIALIGLLI